LIEFYRPRSINRVAKEYGKTYIVTFLIIREQKCVCYN
jgi:hypothetical protein